MKEKQIEKQYLTKTKDEQQKFSKVVTKRIVPSSWKIEEMKLGENAIFVRHYKKTEKDEEKYIFEIKINSKSGSLGSAKRIKHITYNHSENSIKFVKMIPTCL